MDLKTEREVIDAEQNYFKFLINGLKHKKACLIACMYDYILVHIPVINREEAFILFTYCSNLFYTKTLHFNNCINILLKLFSKLLRL